MTARVRRWPLHPEPAPTEALSSWLERTASLYDLSAQDLLGHNLGSASIALAAHRDLDLDWDPPHELLLALAERTGLGLDRLRPMTIAGWIPWLTDTLDLDNGQVVFDTYVRGQSVLFKPGKARRTESPDGVPGCRSVPYGWPARSVWPNPNPESRCCGGFRSW